MADKSEEWDKQERFNEIESMDDIVEIHLIKDGYVKIFRDGEKLPHDGYKLFAIKLTPLWEVSSFCAGQFQRFHWQTPSVARRLAGFCFLSCKFVTMFKMLTWGS